METVHLVAVQHDDLGNLLSYAMYPLIQNQVIPLLTADSVLVVEGGKGRGKLTNDNPAYNTIYSQLGPICYTGLRPVIHSDDPMYQQKDRDVPAYIKQSDDYTKEIIRLLDFRHKPSTWEELIETIRLGRHDVKMNGALSKKWKAFAADLKKEFLQRDDAYINQVNGYFSEGNDVFFFGGVLHCISLNVRCSWPVIRYPCTSENIFSFYQAWFQVYGMVDLLK